MDPDSNTVPSAWDRHCARIDVTPVGHAELLAELLAAAKKVMAAECELTVGDLWLEFRELERVIALVESKI